MPTRQYAVAATSVVALVTAAFVAAAPVPRGPAPTHTVVLRDEFDGKFALNWKPVRPDATHVSLTRNPGKLTITTQRGSIHGDEAKDQFGAGLQAKNIYLIDSPLAPGGDFVVTTSVSGFKPETTFQQAGLIVYDGDDDYLKFGYEYSWQGNGGQAFTLVKEVAAVPEHDSAAAEKGLTRVWLRLTKRGDRYEYAVSPDGTAWAARGETLWRGKAARVGVLAKNGGNKDAPEIDAAFDFFELRSPPPAKGR